MRRELLRELHAIIDGIPDDRFDLSDIASSESYEDVSADNCGTIACGIGWAALHPTFNALGLTLSRAGNELFWKGKVVPWSTAGAKLFKLAPSQAFDLFRPAGICETYPELDDGYVSKVATHDKQVFLGRLRRLLKTGCVRQLKTGRVRQL